ncbi:hypothetical protein ACOMHN_015808 [Nucella lapillus]
MGLAAPLLLCVLMCVTWVDPTMATPGCILHFNKTTLHNYAMLFQQLRYQLTSLRQDLTTQVANIRSAIADREVTLRSGLNDALVLRSDFVARAVNVTARLKMNLAPALLVHTPSFYGSASEPFFTQVKINHGFSYDTNNGEAVVPIDGVYLIEYKIQPISYWFFKSEFFIYAPDGTLLVSIPEFWSYISQVLTRMYNLKAGSKVKISGMLDYYSWYPSQTYYLDTGVGRNQLLIRYFGPGT